MNVMNNYKVICVDSKDERKMIPLVLSVPEGIIADNNKIKKWASCISWQGNNREWHQGKFYLTEEDAKESFFLRPMFESKEWETLEPVWLKTPSTAGEALEYAKILEVSVPEYESLIAQDSEASFSYSCEKNSVFPLGEEAISKNLNLSVAYSDFHGARIRQAESGLAEDDTLSVKYGEAMTNYCLWNTWSLDEIARSPAWIYMYAKEELNGTLPDELHSAMALFSFKNPKNKWVKKYFRSKRLLK